VGTLKKNRFLGHGTRSEMLTGGQTIPYMTQRERSISGF
jgi:hypothetical protein